jgi:hypothetical protein
MAKKGQRQARQVRRVVRPKNMPQLAAAQQGTPEQQRKQRQQYVQSGGILQGYAPELVLRIGYIAGGAALGCLLIVAAILLLLPYGWPVRIVAASVWLVPVAFAASFILPAFRLARKDRREEPRLVRGQLLGASSVSTSFGLGILMVQTRSGMEQFLVSADKLAKVPGNQVSVMVTVTPHLNHVRNVGLIGQRMMGRAEPQVPEVVRRLRLLPIATPVILSAAAILGGDGVGFAPIPGDALHAGLAMITAVVLAGAVYGGSFLLQRRMYAEVQSLLPGGL